MMVMLQRRFYLQSRSNTAAQASAQFVYFRYLQIIVELTYVVAQMRCV